MAARPEATPRQLGAWTLLLALCGCADNGYLESTTVESICVFNTRLAVIVSIVDADAQMVDSVTATHQDTEPCYLDSLAGDGAAEDAGAPSSARFSCWDQGGGSYVVSVRSGKHTWTKHVDVPGDDCHASEVQHVSFALE